MRSQNDQVDALRGHHIVQARSTLTIASRMEICQAVAEDLERRVKRLIAVDLQFDEGVVICAPPSDKVYRPTLS
jgi:hypothetical protein